MQHGALGEARARAFLLDRFWVLERSVDVQGADLIIQRRLTGKNLLDREAPRLGVVQVKFFGTATTNHFVAKEYVLDQAGNPHKEFFLFCHAGDEDAPRLFIVHAPDLHQTFPAATREGHEGYSISYKALTSNQQFAVTSPKRALDRIEHQLELAEFSKNRRFLSMLLPSATQDLTAIEPLYREPIDNWWGDIPEGFRELKAKARQAMIDVEEIYDLLRQITEQVDPTDAEKILDQIAYHCRDGYGRWSISLPRGLYNEDLFQVSRIHKRTVELLRRDGLLDAFLAMKDVLRGKVTEFVVPRLPMGRDSVHLFTLEYNAASFAITNVASQLVDFAAYLTSHPDVEERDFEGIEHKAPGIIVYRWRPGVHGYHLKENMAIQDSFRVTDFRCYYDCLDAALTMKYGESALLNS
jgi:hypothetical protein